MKVRDLQMKEKKDSLNIYDIKATQSYFPYLWGYGS